MSQMGRLFQHESEMTQAEKDTQEMSRNCQECNQEKYLGETAEWMGSNLGKPTDHDKLPCGHTKIQEFFIGIFVILVMLAFGISLLVLACAIFIFAISGGTL